MRRTVDDNAIGDKLHKMGFAHLPPEKIRRSTGSRAGSYLRVCTKGDEPVQLALSTDLRLAAGIGQGTLIDVYYAPGKLALVVGEGSIRLTKSGSGMRFNCPLLLQTIHAQPGEIFPASFSDGVVMVVLGEDRMKRAAEEGRRAQAAANPAH